MIHILHPNIVQAEFFLLKGGETPDEAYLLAMERAAEGSRIKIVVRFFDDTGLVSKFVNNSAGIRELVVPAVRTLEESRGLFSWPKRLKARRLLRSESNHRKASLSFLKQAFFNQFYRKRLLAIEDFEGDPFRFLEGNERKEILEKVRAASNVWVFMFKPNDLVADNLKLINSYM